MGLSVRGSVVVITGASSGIGRATALELARRGAKLVLAGRREDSLEDVAMQCLQHGVPARVVATDVTDPEAVASLGRIAIETFGRIDVWLNNAGVFALGSLDQTP